MTARDRIGYRRKMGHDARTFMEIGLSQGSPRIARPYGWSCPCGARGERYKTGASAKASAIRHNGGYYNEG